MSLVSKINGECHWQPSTTLQAMQARAAMLASIRQFFAERQVLEVETPLLCRHSVTDVFIESFSISVDLSGEKQQYFLQTSPEYAMKRLLAAGVGSIYQISKAFRREECGSEHNPEFSMLEWYRVGFDHHQLMAELDLLCQAILKTSAAEKVSYQQLFLDSFSIDPFVVSHEALLKIAQEHMSLTQSAYDHDTLLQLLLNHCIEPHLGLEKPIFIYDFPASQAALAKTRIDQDRLVGERFELYFKGVELANGFHELADAAEQARRFQKDRTQRQQLGLPDIEMDARLIAALEYGLPQCAGVAVGLDRLLMLMMGEQHIRKVVNFTWQDA